MKDDFPDGDDVAPKPGGPRARRPVAHTQVHSYLRQVFETLQDVIICLLLGLLLCLAVLALWRIARMAFVEGSEMNQLLSEMMYVLILTELYRLLIFYLREHRVSVALTVEVALVSTLREVILKGAHESERPRIMGLSVLLVVLGGLLAVERWMGRWRDEVSETDACRPHAGALGRRPGPRRVQRAILQ